MDDFDEGSDSKIDTPPSQNEREMNCDYKWGFFYLIIYTIGIVLYVNYSDKVFMYLLNDLLPNTPHVNNQFINDFVRKAALKKTPLQKILPFVLT